MKYTNTHIHTQTLCAYQLDISLEKTVPILKFRPTPLLLKYHFLYEMKFR